MNTNCLEGRECPKCHQDKEILIVATMWVSLKDSGTDPYADTVHEGSVEYDEKSMAECPECHFVGRFGKFKVKEKKSGVKN